MSVRRPGRILYGIAFVVLLGDGVAAIWLGQVGARTALVVLGACLVLGAIGLGILFRRWEAALEDVDRARRALRAEVEALRRVVRDAPRGPGLGKASHHGDSGSAGGAGGSPQLDASLRRRN